jgi:hypothetical protein
MACTTSNKITPRLAAFLISYFEGMRSCRGTIWNSSFFYMMIVLTGLLLNCADVVTAHWPLTCGFATSRGEGGGGDTVRGHVDLSVEDQDADVVSQVEADICDQFGDYIKSSNDWTVVWFTRSHSSSRLLVIISVLADVLDVQRLLGSVISVQPVFTDDDLNKMKTTFVMRLFL